MNPLTSNEAFEFVVEREIEEAMERRHESMSEAL